MKDKVVYSHVSLDDLISSFHMQTYHYQWPNSKEEESKINEVIEHNIWQLVGMIYMEMKKKNL